MQQTPNPLAQVPEAAPPLVVHSELKTIKFNIKYYTLDIRYLTYQMTNWASLIMVWLRKGGNSEIKVYHSPHWRL